MEQEPFPVARMLLAGPIVRMTQFYRQKDDGTHFNGTCGQTALAVCIAAVRGTPADFEGVGELMIAITRQMIANGTAQPNGGSRIEGLAAQAQQRDMRVVLVARYADPAMAQWRDLLREHAGKQPIVLMLARGGNLVDSETHAHNATGLQYHFIAIVGQENGDFLAADSANPEIMRRLQRYSTATLAAAQPCGLLMLDSDDAPDDGKISTQHVPS